MITLNYSKDIALQTEFDSTLLQGTQIIKTKTMQLNGDTGIEVKLIPYYLWNNRGPSEMQVWLSTRKPKVIPDSLIILDLKSGDKASTNYVSRWETLSSIYDLYDPVSSDDKGPDAFGNWGGTSTIGSWNWVEYDFTKNYTIGSSSVYWWDDHEGITLPDSAFLSYYNPNTSKYEIIPGTSVGMISGGIKWNQYNTVVFSPVITKKVRLYFLGNSKAQGILEWSVFSTNRPVSIKNRFYNSDIFSVNPNPVNDYISIKCNSSGISNIEVYNCLGAIIYKNFFTKELIIGKDELEGNGIYIVQLSNRNTVRISKVIVK